MLKGLLRLISCIGFLGYSFFAHTQSDECFNATIIIPMDNCRASPGSTSGPVAETVQGECGGEADDAGWFQFEAESNLSSIRVFSDAGVDMSLALYTTCQSEINCINEKGAGEVEELTIVTQVGRTYFIKVFNTDPGTGEFDICIVNNAENPQSDCVDAFIVCKDELIKFIPTGIGIDDFEDKDNFEGCLKNKENQSAWYYFEIDKDAPANLELGFQITPQEQLDYDFALFGPNKPCDALGYPIRCSWADKNCSYCPSTGLDVQVKDISEKADGDGLLATLLVQAGEGYFLLVDNFSNNTTAFELNWTGPAAAFLNCNAEKPCTITANAGKTLFVCGDEQVQLSGKAEGDYSSINFQWQGESTLLDDQTIPNPLVSLPPGFTGTLEYNLLVTQGDCTATSKTLIQYKCFDSEQDRCQSTLSAFVAFESPTCDQGDSGKLFIGKIEGGTGPYDFSINRSDFQSEPIFNNLSTGLYQLTIRDLFGCEVDYDIQITESVSPELDIGQDRRISYGEKIVVKAETLMPLKNTQDISWSGFSELNCNEDCSEVTFAPTETGTLVATLHTVDHCMTQSEIKITVLQEFDFFLPSAFSPNGDGINDRFTIYTQTGISNIASMSIYNRWGNLLFQKFNFPPNQEEDGWDGRYLGEVIRAGVYSYYVEMDVPNGGFQKIKGVVTVIGN